MESENAVEVGAQNGAKGRERSSIQFPYGDLNDAIEVVKKMHERGGMTCTLDQLCAWLGHENINSGTFRTKVAAARMLGLIETSRDNITMRPLGSQILDPQRQTQAKVSAFLSVPLYREIYTRYKGGMLPKDVGLENEMRMLGVAAKQTDKARQAFQRSAKQAGLFGQGEDRLVLPGGTTADDVPGATIVPLPPGAGLEDGQEKRKNGGGSGGGENPPPLDDVDPLIAGLVRRLPKADSDFPKSKRKKWMSTLDSAFDMIYKDSESTTK